MTTAMTLPRKRPLWIFTALLLIFGIPLLLAWIGAYQHNSFGYGTTNHGQLIQPPLDLTKLQLQDAQSQPLDQAVIKEHWLLLYVHPGICDAGCEKNLYYLRQIRTATGKDSGRISRALLTFTDQQSDPTATQRLQNILATDFAGTTHLTTTAAEFAGFIRTAPTTLKLQNQGIYLVDPLSNVMMYYPPNTAPMGIFKDLTRLLKLSHIG